MVTTLEELTMIKGFYKDYVMSSTFSRKKETMVMMILLIVVMITLT